MTYCSKWVIFVLSVVEEIAQAIEQFQGLKALRLEGNTLGVEAAQAISKALESKKDLQVIYLFSFGLCVSVFFDRMVSPPECIPSSYPVSPG